jgi:hypothetical protein
MPLNPLLNNVLLEGKTRKYWLESWKPITLTPAKISIDSIDYPIAQISTAYISSYRTTDWGITHVYYYLNFDLKSGYPIQNIALKDALESHFVISKWVQMINSLISRKERDTLLCEYCKINSLISRKESQLRDKESQIRDTWLCEYCKMPNNSGCSCSRCGAPRKSLKKVKESPSDTTKQ